MLSLRIGVPGHNRRLDRASGSAKIRQPTPSFSVFNRLHQN
jgi:hypothetical protein